MLHAQRSRDSSIATFQFGTLPCRAEAFDKPSMIPEGEVKLAPQARRPLPASDEAGPHGQQAWLSRDAPYDRMTGMVRRSALSVGACSCLRPSTIALLLLTLARLHALPDYAVLVNDARTLDN